MTAKKILNKYLRRGSDTYLAGQEDNIDKAMKEYAIYIAEKAVEESIWDHRHVISTCDSVLSRVKALTEES